MIYKNISFQDHLESSICTLELLWFLNNIKSVKMKIKADHIRKNMANLLAY